MVTSFQDFQNIDLRVAKVFAVERIEGSEKLLKLEVDLGTEQRQLVAGIGKTHTPEQLVGREIIVVANLEPRTLMGHESQGMLLAARDENDLPVLLSLEKEVPPGTKIS